MKYIDLSIQDRQDILRRVQSETGKDLQIIEKDCWVVAVLRALFEQPYAQPSLIIHLFWERSLFRVDTSTIECGPQRIFSRFTGRDTGSGKWTSPKMKNNRVFANNAKASLDSGL